VKFEVGVSTIHRHKSKLIAIFPTNFVVMAEETGVAANVALVFVFNLSAFVWGALYAFPIYLAEIKSMLLCSSSILL